MPPSFDIFHEVKIIYWKYWWFVAFLRIGTIDYAILSRWKIKEIVFLIKDFIPYWPPYYSHERIINKFYINL
jgi:hypothetical protein